MSAPKPTPKAARPESRDRLFIGVELMDRLKALCDRYAEKHSFRPTPQRMLEMLVTKAKG